MTKKSREPRAARRLRVRSPHDASSATVDHDVACAATGEALVRLMRESPLRGVKFDRVKTRGPVRDVEF